MAHFLTKPPLIVALLFLVAILPRFWQLQNYPPSLSMDEVGFGYNAYSILKTGKDEFGTSLPLVFQALGDYKPGVDVYLTALSIKVFGLNEFAVRFPTALFGSLTIPLIFLLLKKFRLSTFASAAGGLWLGLSPWHIFFSRANYEATIALFFLLAGLYCFVIWIVNTKVRFLSLAFAFFSLSVWSYNAQRLFVPLLFLFLLFLFRKDFLRQARKNLKNLLLPFLILIFFSIPFLYLLLSGDTIKARAEDLWVVKDPKLAIQLHNGQYGSLAEFLFDNDLYLIPRWLVQQYLNYYSPYFWFWKGLRLTPTDYQDIGLFNPADLALFLIGIHSLVKAQNKRLKNIILFWFLAGPIPGAFTRGEESPIRALLWLPVFVFLIALAFQKIEKAKYRIYLIPGVLLVSAFGLIYFFDLYINNFPKFYADIWHYGYKEVAHYACANRNKYDQIIITDKYGVYWPSVRSVPYIYILFYCQYNPEDYINNRQIYNFILRQPHWRLDGIYRNTLIIGSRWDFPEGFPEEWIKKKIYFPNDKEAFLIVETSQDKLRGFGVEEGQMLIDYPNSSWKKN